MTLVARKALRVFTFTDPVADDAAIRAASTLGLEQHALRELRHTRRAEARTVLLAHKIGHSVYNDMLGDPDPHRADPVAAEKAASGKCHCGWGCRARPRTAGSSWASP